MQLGGSGQAIWSTSCAQQCQGAHQRPGKDRGPMQGIHVVIDEVHAGLRHRRALRIAYFLGEAPLGTDVHRRQHAAWWRAASQQKSRKLPEPPASAFCSATFCIVMWHPARSLQSRRGHQEYTPLSSNLGQGDHKFRGSRRDSVLVGVIVAVLSVVLCAGWRRQRRLPTRWRKTLTRE